MAKYPGAVSTGGYPSLGLQQHMAHQRVRATVAAAPTEAQRAANLRDVGAEIRNGTSAQALAIMLRQQVALLGDAAWYAPLLEYISTVNINGRYTDAQRAEMLAIINEYNITSRGL